MSDQPAGERTLVDRVGLVLAIFVRTGYVTLVFSIAWLFVLILFQGIARVPIPGDPVGVMAAIGLPPDVFGVPTLYAVVGGVVSMLALYRFFKDDEYVPL